MAGNGYCPLMGFEEERYIPAHPDHLAGSWSKFYTCIANGKRVYVWAYDERTGLPYSTCCVMVSDNISDPARNAEVAEIQHMFADQHTRQKERLKSRTHSAPLDPFLLQAFIHHVTCGGNENFMLKGRKTNV